MIDMRWTATDTFETTASKAPFSELIRLAMILGATIRDSVGNDARGERLDGVAGHAA